MIGVVARRIGAEDIAIKNWLESQINTLTIDYTRVEEDIISILSQYDLSLFVSESDSFLNEMKRAETGSFYTPVRWVKYMTRIALCDWVATELCMENVEAEDIVKASLASKYQACSLSEANIVQLYNALPHIKVIDIACGAGAFLIEMVKCLTRMHTYLEKCLGRTSSVSDIADHYISKSVVGIDLQAEPLAVYTLCLMWAYGSKVQYKFQPCTIIGDSLEDNLFEENEILSAVMQDGGFDIVIGNPPYLGEKGNTKVFKAIRASQFGKLHYEGKMDLSYFFTLKSLEIMKFTGSLTYLTTNYFITADGAVKYRNFLRSKAVFTHILNFNSYPVFKEALGQHNMIYALKKRTASTDSIETKVKYVLNQTLTDKLELDYKTLLNQKENSTYVNVYVCPEASLYNDDGTISILSDDAHREALMAYEAFCTMKLKDEFQINQGIVSGADQVSGLMLRSKLPKKHIHQYQLEKGQPIFVFSNEDQGLSEIEEACLRPFYKNSDIAEYVIQPRTHRSIIYLDKLLDNVEGLYPNTIEHLNRFKPVLEARREVKTGTRPWYALQWPRKPEVFEGAKIVVPQRSKVNRFAFTSEPFYCSADVYYFKADHLSLEAWYYYLGILNSSIMYLWLYNNGKRKGELLELYAKPLLETVVPGFEEALWQYEISSTVKGIMESNSNIDSKTYKENKSKIDQIIFSAMGLKNENIKRIVDFRNRHNNA